MLKINWFLSLTLLASVVMVSSCKKNSSEPSQPPAITLHTGTGYVSTEISVTVNTPLKFGVRALANATTNSMLVKFTMTRAFNNSSQSFDSIFEASSYDVDYLTHARSTAGKETFVFAIKDQSGQINSVTAIVTTIAVHGEINTFSSKILGAQNNSNGKAYSSTDGKVYSLAEAKASANAIDWLYYNDAIDHATIAAPGDANAAAIYNDMTDGLQTWAVLNQTKFKEITDAVDFNAITNDSVILVQTAAGVDLSRIANLTDGKLLGFITTAGKHGILKVETITGTADGTMTISVKVQK